MLTIQNDNVFKNFVYFLQILCDVIDFLSFRMCPV